MSLSVRVSVCVIPEGVFFSPPKDVFRPLTKNRELYFLGPNYYSFFQLPPHGVSHHALFTRGT